MAETFNRLPDAQAHARANSVVKYWRLIFVDNDKAYAGGWLSEMYPRERFYFSREQLEADVLTQIRRNNRVDVSTVWTDNTSDSVNAR